MSSTERSLDPGANGFTGISALNQSLANKYFGADKLAFQLGYYGGDGQADYIPAKLQAPTNLSMFAPYSTLWNTNTILPNTGANNEKGLYNGNIAMMLTDISLKKMVGTTLTEYSEPLLNTYQYDQLNRIKKHSTAYYRPFGDGVSGATGWLGRGYGSEYSYDANGNITNLKRWAPGIGSTDPTFSCSVAPVNYTYSSCLLDNIDYFYQKATVTDPNGNRSYLLHNKLLAIRDFAVANTTAGDIEQHSVVNVTDDVFTDVTFHNIDNPNYTYDAIGNLTSDASEGITDIQWNVYGKISSISKTLTTNVTQTITFGYDAMSNRVSKKVALTDQPIVKVTYYMRDASGNIMATIEADEQEVMDKDELVHQQQEQRIEYPIYGSSRLGVYTRSRAELLQTRTNRYSRTIGQKMYELSDHLGNVLNTISDRKVGYALSADPNKVAYYTAELTSATDYYPGGMPMPGRQYSSDKYRFGFNGMENDNEIKGQGNSVDYGARMYDSRLMRWLSLDPLQSKYPDLSPYNFCTNNPIIFVDNDGREVEFGGQIPKKFQNAIFGFVKNSAIMGFIYRRMAFSHENYLIGIDGAKHDGMSYGATSNSLLFNLFTNKEYNHYIYYNSASIYHLKGNEWLFKAALYEEMIHAGQLDFIRTTGTKMSSLCKEVEARVFRAFENFSQTGKAFTTNDGDKYALIKEGPVDDFKSNVAVQNYFQAIRQNDIECKQEYEEQFRSAVGEMAKAITTIDYYGKETLNKDCAGLYEKLQGELKDYNNSNNPTPFFDAITKK